MVIHDILGLTVCFSIISGLSKNCVNIPSLKGKSWKQNRFLMTFTTLNPFNCHFRAFGCRQRPEYALCSVGKLPSIFVVTATSRKIRDKDEKTNGVDYIFVTSKNSSK